MIGSPPRRPRLSIFFPCHDEEANVEEAVRAALRVGPRVADDFEVIVVDDGSTDRTAEVSRRLAAEDARVRLVRHETNRGYGGALVTGIRAARGDLVFWTDGDNQFDLDELPAFLSELARADVVIGYRIDRQDHWMRRLNGVLWSGLVRLLFRVRSRDVDCAFKVVPRRWLTDLPLASRGAMISTELLVRLGRRGARIVERGVRHRPRRFGEASGAKLAVIVRAFGELFRLYGELTHRGGGNPGGGS